MSSSPVVQFRLKPKTSYDTIDLQEEISSRVVSPANDGNLDVDGNVYVFNHARNMSQVVARDVWRYYTAISLSMPAFTEAEALLIVDALNGVLFDTTTAQSVVANITSSLELDHLDQRYDIDIALFKRKLYNLSYFECVALCDVVERIWNISTYNIEESLIDRIKKNGLVRSPDVAPSPAKSRIERLQLLADNANMTINQYLDHLES